MVDKVLITNVTAQTRKYRADGYRKVRRAVRDLIAADAARGLDTVLVDISDPSAMKKYNATAISDHCSEVQNKEAVDRVYASIRPHYLVLLDGPDVVPHILLANPVGKDGDENVPSDLPYASEVRFIERNVAKRHIATYAAVTRVVGRIPGVTGTNDPSALITQIKAAATFKSRGREDYLSHFALSSFVLRNSTSRSIDYVFRSELVSTSPPIRSPKRRMLGALCHFINCDGGKDLPAFFGHRGTRTVVSLTSDDVARSVRRHTIVAAECCYGARLFAASAAHGKLPIANAYLNAGAIAFFGSTNIAYGSLDGNAGADLIVQYFLVDVLESTSVGRACLQARQKFVRTQMMENPVNLKTLAQFVLLGDPSLQPVRSGEEQDEGFLQYVDVRNARLMRQEARLMRRVALAAAGEAAVSCSGFPGRKAVDGKTRLRRLVRKIAHARGFRASADAAEAYLIVGRGNLADAMEARRVKQTVFVVTHRGSTNAKTGVPSIRVMVAHAQNDNLTRISEYVRR